MLEHARTLEHMLWTVSELAWIVLYVFHGFSVPASQSSMLFLLRGELTVRCNTGMPLQEAAGTQATWNAGKAATKANRTRTFYFDLHHSSSAKSKRIHRRWS